MSNAVDTESDSDSSVAEVRTSIAGVRASSSTSAFASASSSHTSPLQIIDLTLSDDDADTSIESKTPLESNTPVFEGGSNEKRKRKLSLMFQPYPGELKVVPSESQTTKKKREKVSNANSNGVPTPAKDLNIDSLLGEQTGALLCTVNIPKTTIKDIEMNSVSAAEVESIVKHNKELLEENAILNDTLKEKEVLISNLKAQNEDLREEHRKEVDSIKKELVELQKSELALKKRHKKDIAIVKKELKAKDGELLAAQTINAKDEMLRSQKGLFIGKLFKECSLECEQASKKGPATQFSSTQGKTATTSAPKPKAGVASGSGSSSSSSSLGTSSARNMQHHKKASVVERSTIR